MTLLIDPSGVAPVPWRNGAGSTRELAVLVDEDGLTQWRVSLADLDRDAGFSRFPDTDRLFVPLGPVRMRVGEREIGLAAGEPLRFDGAAPVAVRVEAPTRAVNVMVRAGGWDAEVVLRGAAECIEADADADADAVACAGRGVDVVVPLGDLVAEITVKKITVTKITVTKAGHD